MTDGTDTRNGKSLGPVVPAVLGVLAVADRFRVAPHWAAPAGAAAALVALWVWRWTGRSPGIIDSYAFLFVVALAAAWFAARPPWAPLVGAVIWGGALLIVVGVPEEWNRFQAQANLLFVLVVGMAVGAGVALVAPFSRDVSMLSLVVGLGVGRAVAWRVAERHGVTPAALFVGATVLPFLPGPYGLAVAGIEAAGLFVVWRVLPEGSGWPWVLGAAGAAAGFYARI